MVKANHPDMEGSFWRRALVATALAIVSALGWGAASRLISSAVPAHAATSSCRPDGRCLSGEPPSSTTYVVRPGDTIWAIAVRYSHGGDPRSLEYELEDQTGGASLQPGEVLHVP